ncbi:MAG: UvrD-helicase domain-containing protein [Candidatus Dormibacteraeota bacterium]|nr:UvrD-helicase domain-containing protein [Candidatus Dormibacteraeota bacterium]
MDALFLNPPQRQAVTHEKGPLLIFAGAGSGKTRVLTMRIANLIQAGVAEPERILALTFTNKAAREMRSRLTLELGAAQPGMWIGTFHAIATRMLRPHAELLGYRSGFVIFDEDDSRSILKQALADLELDLRKNPLPPLLEAISKAKSELLRPADIDGKAVKDRIVRVVYERYQELSLESNGMDFDDLILNLVHLLRQNPGVLEQWRDRFDQVLVDEYQDTNRAQYELLIQLAGGHRNLTVVGDDDQSIYAFRGADVRNILGFQRDFPEAKVVKLEQNYRSTQAILDTAHAVIKRNPERTEKRLWTDEGQGRKPVVLLAPDDGQEARFVAAEIAALVENESHGHGDFAILYRTNAQSRAFERALLAQRIPYNLVGGLRFWDRREVKDVIAYLRFLVNPADAVSFDRVANVPRRRISDRTVQSAIGSAADGGTSILEMCGTAAQVPAKPEAQEALGRFHAEVAPLFQEAATRKPSELVQLVIRRCNLAEHYDDGTAGAPARLNNLEELREIARGYDRHAVPRGLERMLTDIALTADLDDLDESRQRVTLITLHMAKGLEFPVVFLTGLEDKLLPHERAFAEPRRLEEERRLCYVGITRARSRLYLTVANVRTLFGKPVILAPSQFLYDIPSELLHLVELDGHRSQGMVRHFARGGANAKLTAS